MPEATRFPCLWDGHRARNSQDREGWEASVLFLGTAGLRIAVKSAKIGGFTYIAAACGLFQFLARQVKHD